MHNHIPFFSFVDSSLISSWLYVHVKKVYLEHSPDLLTVEMANEICLKGYDSISVTNVWKDLNV